MKPAFLNRIVLSSVFLFWVSHIMLLSFSILIFTSISFFLGLFQNQFILPISFLLSIFISVLMYKSLFIGKKFLNIVAIIFPLLFIYGFSYTVSSHFYDISWDGQEYHQEIILQISDNNWNPIQEKVPDSTDDHMKIWVEHYPKSSEILSSSIYEITHSIESGKTFNLLFIIASFFIILGAILKYSKIGIFTGILLSLAVALNPVSVYQSMSYYLDGQIASMAVILLALIYVILQKNGTKYLILLISVMAILINLKFTGIAFAGLGCLSLLFFSLLQKNRELFKKIFLASVIGTLIAIFLIGFHPYIQNTLEHKNPFYPLVGNESVNIMTGIVPQNLLEVGNVKKFVISHFSLTNTGREINWRLPFVPDISRGQFPRCYGDARVTGEGLYFMEISIIAIFLLLEMIILKKVNFSFIVALIFLAVGVVVIPDNWWARYVPFLYLIPWLVLMFSFMKYKQPRFLSQLLLFVILLNNLTELDMYIKPQIDNTKAIQEIIEVSKKSSKSVKVHSTSVYFLNNVKRFEENNIEYELINNNEEWYKMDGQKYSFPYSNIEVKIPKE